MRPRPKRSDRSHRVTHSSKTSALSHLSSGSKLTRMPMSDNRGASLVHAPDYHPNVRTIPRKKPATIDNVQELESDNAPRKPRLAAHTSRAGVSNNRPGR